MSRHPTIDLSVPVPTRAYPIPIEPYSIALENPQPIVETPATFESEIPGLALIIGILGTGTGLFVGWQACNLLMSTELYQSWAKEIIMSILPIRKIQLLSGIGGIVVEVVAAALGIEVPELE